MRPVERGTSPRTFKDYREAVEPLIERIGRYCSYCEKNLDNIPAVEHVLPKSRHPGLRTDWHNFLLACVVCNSIKGNQDVIRSKHSLPDEDNTFLAFRYSENGLIEINSKLRRTQQAVALTTMKLLGLDRYPGHPDGTRRDDLTRRRREVWDIAMDAKGDLARNPSPHLEKWIVETMKAKGFWSVWMTVFHDDEDMRRRFINALAGTHQDSFDADTRPIPRGKI